MIFSGSADLAHLVERDLAKVEVAGSSPVIRSRIRQEIKDNSADVSCYRLSLALVYIALLWYGAIAKR